MPITTLDPVTALIAIDLQKGIVEGQFIHPMGEIVASLLEKRSSAA